MFVQRLGRLVAASAVLCAALASSAAAQVRVTAEPFIQLSSGAMERTLFIDAGVENAGAPYLAIPQVNGEASRALATRLDRFRGRLDRSGRAAIQLRLGALQQLNPSVLRALRQGASLSVTVGNAGLQTATSNLASASALAAANLGPAAPLSDVAPVQLITPRTGDVVGSPTIDVRGRLEGPFNRGGTQVTVNGTAAEVFPSPGGAGQFVLRNVELTNGQNALDIAVTSPLGPSFRTDATVTLQRTTANNVVLHGGFAYAARGTAGLAVMDLFTRRAVTIPPPAGSGRVDDVDVADGLLFLLDGGFAGRLSVMSLDDPQSPALVSGPISVPTGPFAGVSARSGRVVVSGGTSLLTVRSYATNGTLGGSVASIDLGIGQPDVLLSDDGTRAFVSTDFSGSFGGAGFGITTIGVNAPPTAPVIESRTGIPGAGFSAGFQGPANFPIESALVNGELVTAHGAGLSRIASNGALIGTTPLGFAAVNVDASGDRAFVVGTGRRLAELDFGGSGAPALVGTTVLPGPGTFTGVAADGAHVVIAANAGGLRVMSR